MSHTISTKSAAIGSALLLTAAVGATIALNSSAASGATPTHRAATRPAALTTPGTSAIYLRAPNITGVSTDKGYAGWVPLTSIASSFAVPTSGGLVTGRMQVQPFLITKKIDLATPDLMKAMSTNTVLGKIEIRVVSVDAKGLPKVTSDYTLEKALVTGDSAGIGGGTNQEHVEFTFQKMTLTETLGSKTTTVLIDNSQPLG